MPEDDLFADESTPATAAVMLGNPADTLESGAVRGIAQLVASSVKGLKTENVTITDSSGAAPVAPGGRAAAPAAARAAKQAAEARYARPLEANLNAMLTRTLGPGKAQVQVNADLNVDKIRATRSSRTPRRACRSPRPTETEKLKGGGGATARRHRRHGLEHPDLLRRAPRRPAARNYQRAKKHPDAASTRPSPRREVAPGARQQAQRRAAGRQVGPGRVAGAAADDRHAPPASTRPAATRSR